MGRKKKNRSNRLKDLQKKSDDFLKTITIREHEDHVYCSLTVDNLKIVVRLKLIEEEGDKVLLIRDWNLSMNGHKYVYCIHLLLEYVKYYAELNKIPLVAKLPHSDEAITGTLNEDQDILILWCL